jgi:DNA-binding winged helix-turn-helix (wHTH) protein
MVTIKDQRIELTPTEYSVLELLAIKKGTILSKRIFINHLYPNITKKQNMDKKRDKIVDVFICKLRNKLKSIGGREYISTMWGRGYTLQGTVLISRAHIAETLMTPERREVTSIWTLRPINAIMGDVEFLNPHYPSLMNLVFMENYPETRFLRLRRY